MDGSFFTGALGLALLFFLIVLALLWFLLPFAVFGIKDKLSALEKRLAEVNGNLEKIAVHASSVDYYAKRVDDRACAAARESTESTS